MLDNKILSKTPEPVWQHFSCYPLIMIPWHLQDWLIEPNSLTQRLKDRCRSSFRVGVIAEYQSIPAVSECSALNIPANGAAQLREVYLICDDKPVIFARSVLPLTTVKLTPVLNQIDNRPLGEILFTDPSMTRQDFELALIKPGQWPYQRMTQKLMELPEWFWGRRSVFTLQQRPLLVSEVFLTNMRLV